MTMENPPQMDQVSEIYFKKISDGLSDFSFDKKKEEMGAKGFKEDAGWIFENVLIKSMRKIPGVANAFLSSVADDCDHYEVRFDKESKKTGKQLSNFDGVVLLENGSVLTLQITASENRIVQNKKLENIKQSPVVTRILDPKGDVVFRGVAPRALYYQEQKTMGEAVNHSLDLDDQEMILAFGKKNYATMKILDSLILGLQLSQHYLHEDLQAEVEYSEKEGKEIPIPLITAQLKAFSDPLEFLQKKREEFKKQIKSSEKRKSPGA